MHWEQILVTECSEKVSVVITDITLLSNLLGARNASGGLIFTNALVKKSMLFSHSKGFYCHSLCHNNYSGIQLLISGGFQQHKLEKRRGKSATDTAAVEEEGSH